MSDRYQILSKLGQGGIGAVYLARDKTLEREVAIKRLLPQEGKPEEARKTGEYLIREAGMLSKLQHPNIVNVFEAGMDEEGAYIVMEMVQGETLDKVVAMGPVSLRDFLAIMEQALEALIAAQEVGMMHRDLKPTNVMLKRRPSGRYDLKVLDFGLAKVSAQPALQTIDHGSSILGSIYFMAPEQFEHVPLDGRTDLYALGCLGYFALTCEFPFEGDTAALVMDAHLEHRLSNIAGARPDLPAPLADWLMRMISRSVDDRPMDARVALIELESIIKNLPKESLGETKPVEKKPLLVTGPAAMSAAATRRVMTVSTTVPKATAAHLSTANALRAPLKKKGMPPWLAPAAVAAALVIAGLVALTFIDGIEAKTADNTDPPEELEAPVVPLRTDNWITPEGHYLPHAMKQSRPLSRLPHGDYKWGALTPSAELIPTQSEWTYMPPAFKKIPPNWKSIEFKAKGWMTGKAPIGSNKGPYFKNGTPLESLPAVSGNKKLAPLYFRNTFIIESDSQRGPLEMHLRADDGAIVYLNNKEVARVGMPYGETAASTPAIRNVQFLGSVNWSVVRFNDKHLKTGKNSIAVRVHARNVKQKDQDMGFDAALYILPRGSRIAPAHDFAPSKKVTMIAPHSPKDPATWKHRDKVDLFSNWSGNAFDDSAWSEAPAPFGVTTESFVPQPRTPWTSQNFFLRRSFKLSKEDLDSDDDFVFLVKTTVHATIHVNGIFAAELKRPLKNRYGLVTLNSQARKTLREGNNTIAIHLGSKNEDRFFDLGLGRISKIKPKKAQ